MQDFNILDTKIDGLLMDYLLALKFSGVSTVSGTIQNVVL